MKPAAVLQIEDGHMKALTNRIVFTVGLGMLAVVPVFVIWMGQSAPSLAIDGILTDCRVRGVIAGGPSPNPALIGEEIVTQLSAEYDQPKAEAECKITGPTWSWTIKKVERKAQNASNWTAHIYRPTLQHSNIPIRIHPMQHCGPFFPSPVRGVSRWM